MDLVKNKYGIALLLIIAVAAIHYFFFYERCEQPSEMDVATYQLQCALAMDPGEFRVRACQKLHNSFECELKEEDRLALEALFLKEINDCAKVALASNNKCIDKYEGLQ